MSASLFGCVCPKHTRDKKQQQRFLIGRNRTKCANFQGNPLFQATYNLTTEKVTKKNQQQQKSETELTASILKKDAKHTRD